MINSAWIIDGLTVSRPNSSVLFGGCAGGGPHIFFLSKDEKITEIEVENCFFGNSYVTGRLTFMIKSSDGIRQIGPFGHSGNPDGSERQHVTETYTITNFNNLHLSTDRTGRFLGPIKSQVDSNFSLIGSDLTEYFHKKNA